ncbi:ABC transporter ATP-binding protein [Rhodopseudomonas sp.]|uniref:ABC transporter ATP-binding protein n=1 Tax=Rhodopseudomonas sp. TaxID=1078 RepID=UPI0039E4043D
MPIAEAITKQPSAASDRARTSRRFNLDITERARTGAASVCTMHNALERRDGTKHGGGERREGGRPSANRLRCSGNWRSSTFVEFAGMGFAKHSQRSKSMAEPQIQLSVRDVRKVFPGKGGPVPVLDGLSFDIYERDFVSIIGPSGCGKTTIFNVIAGLLNADSGSLIYRGEQVSSLRGRIGYMMQKDLLFPWRTVLENVLLGLRVRGVADAEALDTAREYLSTFGLSGFEKAYPKTLSGGMRQRVALIRTLIMDPDILLLDEPFSALDYQTRLYLEGVLMEAVETFNKTVILITHDVDEAVALSKRVVALSGRPTRVKNVHHIDIERTGPVEARSDHRFSDYFHMLCGELDIQTRKVKSN